ncbi:lamin tail domain-containing protein, partial [Sphingomonas sp. ZT3P38]|uniref:lamin tail domain-containing protein n=1 Tax=Parasphingomonas zepuensis TaxID=3096161 RepID=UPI002FC75A8D
TAPVETYEVEGNQQVPLVLEGVRLEAVGEYVVLRITQFGSEDEEHPLDDRVWTAPIWFEPAEFHQPVSAFPRLRMVELVPDPLGDDLTNERITFLNNGTVVIGLAGWRVRDLAGNVWALDALVDIAPGASKTLVRAGQTMSLNNGGDEVELVAPDGSVVQSIAYGRVSVDEVVRADDNS